MREKIDASDLGMKDVKLRNMIHILKENPSVDTLLFTGGNSKNGTEYFFRKHIRGKKEIQLERQKIGKCQIRYVINLLLLVLKYKIPLMALLGN